MTLKAISIAPGNYQNSVELDRVLLDTLGDQTAGVVFESATCPELKITPGAGHTLDVAIGKAIVREKTNPTIRGGYFIQNDTVLNVAFAVPDSQPRIDAVIARVADPQYGSVTGVVGPRIDVISGVPASSPTATSDATIDAVAGTPGGWTRLSDVRINTADVGAVPVGQFTDVRKAGGFGTINCTLANRPVGHEGMTCYVYDYKEIERHNGTVWVLTGSILQVASQAARDVIIAYEGRQVMRTDTHNLETYVPGSGWCLAPGTIVVAPVESAAAGTATVAATETRDAVLGNLVFQALANRRYRVVLGGALMSGTAGDLYRVNIRYAAITPTAAAIVAASTQVPIVTTGGGGQAGFSLDNTFVPGAGQCAMSVFAVRMAGTGTGSMVTGSSRELYVMDAGPA